MKVDVRLKGLDQALAKELDRVERIELEELRAAGEGMRGELKAITAAAGLGPVANSWRARYYLEDKAAFIYTRAPAIIHAFSSGATITPLPGGKYLWIPTENVPRGGRAGGRFRGRLSPGEVRARFQTDFVIRPGRDGGKLAFIDTAAIPARHPSGRRRIGKDRLAGKKGLVLMFVLRRTVKLPRKIDPDAVFWRWAERFHAALLTRI